MKIEIAAPRAFDILIDGQFRGTSVYLCRGLGGSTVEIRDGQQVICLYREDLEGVVMACREFFGDEWCR